MYPSADVGPPITVPCVPNEEIARDLANILGPVRTFTFAVVMTTSPMENWGDEFVVLIL